MTTHQSGSAAQPIAGVVGAVGIAITASVGYVDQGSEDWLEPVIGLVAASLLQTVLYASLTVGTVDVVRRHARSLGRTGRALGYGLAAALGCMAGAFLGMALVGEEGAVVAVVATVGFAFHFLLATPLGLVVWRRTDANRAGAVLLAATVPMLGVAVALSALDLPAHPALGEVPVACGVGLLCWERLTRRTEASPRSGALA